MRTTNSTARVLSACLAGLGLAITTHAQPAPHAQDPAQDLTQQTADHAAEQAREDGRALRRILELHGGTSLRAVARLADGHWEYKSKGDWHALPEGAVRSVTREKDRLKELRELERSAAKGELGERVEVGRWALDHGLLEEGLATIEKALAEDPDHARALSALAANRHRFSVPKVDASAAAVDVGAATEGLVTWCVTHANASREMGLIELAQVEQRAELRAQIERDLFHHSPRRRSFAAHALRRLYPGEALKPLLQRAVLDSSEDVRTSAAVALKHGGEVGVIVPVVNALGSQNGRVRTQAAQALGHMGYPAAVEPLITRLAALQNAGHRVPHSYIFSGRQFAYIQDFDVEVAQFQAVADPQINVLTEGGVLEAGVHGVKDVYFASESRAIRNSLSQLTGEASGLSRRGWLGWWEKNKDEWSTSRKVDAR